MRVIPVPEAHFGYIDRAAGAFGDILASHFDVDTAAISTFGPVDGKEATRFGKDTLERARLVAGVARFDHIAVHRITRPDDGMPLALDGTNERGKAGFNFVMAIAGDERDPARRARRVQRVEQAQKNIGRQARADLDTDGIADAAQELDMRRSFKAGSVADPQHVRAGVIPVAGQRILPSQRLLVREQQRFVAGVELRALQLRHRVGIDPARIHEIERFANTISNIPILLGPWAASHEIMCPGMNLMQIGIATVRKGAEQVQRGGGLVIGLHHALRIGRAASGVERDVVDDVAAIGGELDAIDRFGVGTARFGELAGHAAEFYRRQLRREGQNDGHLEQDAEGIADIVRVEFGERFGAIAALKQKCLAIDDARKIRRQVTGLTGKNKRGKAAECRGGAVHGCRVRVSRELTRFVRGPAGGVPFACHNARALRESAPNCNGGRSVCVT